MKDIAFLIASSFHSGYLPSVLLENNLQYPVYGPASGIQTEEDALACAHRMVDEGVKVIITSGRYPEMLVPRINIPILTLNYSSISFAKAISAARKMSSKVACFLRYGRIYNAALQYKSTFRDKILIAGYEDEKDCAKALEYLRTNQIEVLICGGRGSLLAEKYGYQFEFVRVSFEGSDVCHTVAEAERILQYSSQSDNYAAQLRAIQNGASCGLLAINETGEVIEVNSSALEILGVPRDKIAHQSVKDTMLAPLETALAAQTSRELVQLGGRMVMAQARTVQPESGAPIQVVTLTAAKQVQDSDRLLRARLYSAAESRPVPASSGGSSRAHQRTLEIARRYGMVDSSVLLSGPTGSGKGMLAQYIHQNSRRAKAPFVAIHCASLSEDTNTERLLFGGATSGDTPVYGQLERANGGTLFFDHICDMPLKLQAKLLRTLQTGEIVEPSSLRLVPLDVRVIASSQQNLLQLIREKRFREDLYYILAVLRLEVPSLDRRTEDIIPLLEYYMDRCAQRLGRPAPVLQPQVQAHFTSLRYPGNVRQLMNIAERLVVLSDGGEVDLHLASAVSDAMPEIPSQSSGDMKRNVDAQLVREALAASGGNRARAAQSLGISATTLWRKMKAYHLN